MKCCTTTFPNLTSGEGRGKCPHEIFASQPAILNPGFVPLLLGRLDLTDEERERGDAESTTVTRAGLAIRLNGLKPRAPKFLRAPKTLVNNFLQINKYLCFLGSQIF